MRFVIDVAGIPPDKSPVIVANWICNAVDDRTPYTIVDIAPLDDDDPTSTN